VWSGLRNHLLTVDVETPWQALGVRYTSNDELPHQHDVTLYILGQSFKNRCSTVADPEFYNGGADGRVEWAMLPPRKFFLPENGGFWCILGLVFTFMQKLVRSMGEGGRPWIRHWCSAQQQMSSDQIIILGMPNWYGLYYPHMDISIDIHIHSNSFISLQ